MSINHQQQLHNSQNPFGQPIKVQVGAPDLLKAYNQLTEQYNKQNDNLAEFAKQRNILLDHLKKAESGYDALLDKFNKKNQKALKDCQLECMSLRLINKTKNDLLNELFTEKAAVTLLITNSKRLQALKKEYKEKYYTDL